MTLGASASDATAGDTEVATGRGVDDGPGVVEDDANSHILARGDDVKNANAKTETGILGVVVDIP